jgi:hypothetical protein
MSMIGPVVLVCALSLSGCGGNAAGNGSGALSGPLTQTPSATATATVATPTTKAPPPTGSAPTKTAKPVSDWPSPADCVSYDPTKLTVDGTGAGGTFIVSSGSTVVMRLHGQEDVVGQQALALAQRYTKHCYLGRNNTRSPQGDYIFDYWRDPTGQTPTIPDLDQVCSPYNNHNLTVEDMGDNDGWRVKDHDHVLHVFDNGTDANNADIVFRKYTQACSIGEIQDSDNDLGAVTFQLP